MANTFALKNAFCINCKCALASVKQPSYLNLSRALFGDAVMRRRLLRFVYSWSQAGTVRERQGKGKGVTQLLVVVSSSLFSAAAAAEDANCLCRRCSSCEKERKKENE